MVVAGEAGPPEHRVAGVPEAHHTRGGEVGGGQQLLGRRLSRGHRHWWGVEARVSQGCRRLVGVQTWVGKVHFRLHNHALRRQRGRAVTVGIDWSLELQWVIVMSFHNADVHRRGRGFRHRPLPLGGVALGTTALDTHLFHAVKLRWRSCPHVDVVGHTPKLTRL